MALALQASAQRTPGHREARAKEAPRSRCNGQLRLGAVEEPGHQDGFCGSGAQHCPALRLRSTSHAFLLARHWRLAQATICCGWSRIATQATVQLGWLLTVENISFCESVSSLFRSVESTRASQVLAVRCRHPTANGARHSKYGI